MEQVELIITFLVVIYGGLFKHCVINFGLHLILHSQGTSAAFPSNTPSCTPPGFEPDNTSPSPPPEATADWKSLTPDKLPGIGSVQVSYSSPTDSELYQKLTNDIIKFSETKPGEDIETIIFKLEALKDMFKTDKFDELIKNAKEVKTAIVKRKEQLESDDHEDYLVDENPPHYYGDDGKVLLGYETDE